jgi:hypothetical protein
VPAPTPQDRFKAWYQTDPRYLMQNPQFAAQRSGIYAQYGWMPDGKGGYRKTTAAENPFSQIQALSNALSGNSQAIQNSANSRGLLFSGAQVQGQQNAGTAYEKQLADAQKAFQSALSGVNTDESNLITSLYPDYLKTAPPGSPAAVAAKAVAAKSAASTKWEADRKARVARAQAHLKQDKIDAKRRKYHPRPKPKPQPRGVAGGPHGYQRP